MMIALAGAAVVCVLSLLLGFAARRAATRPLPAHPSTGITAAGKTTGAERRPHGPPSTART